MEYTKEIIKEKLSSDVRWMERAILVLFDYQTDDEQLSERTVRLNGVGFNGYDCRYLSWVAKYLQKGGHLSGHHIQKVGKILPKYWKQIQDVIDNRRYV